MEKVEYSPKGKREPVETVVELRLFIHEKVGLEMESTKSASREQLKRIIDNFFHTKIDKIIKLAMERRNEE